MQVVTKKLTDTKVQLQLTADADQLQAVKQEVLQEMAKTVRIQGFRQGKAPLHLVEKHADPTTLNAEFLDRAMNLIYATALKDKGLRPVDRPEVKVTKFVPFDALEIEAEVETIGEVKLPDYKTMKVERKAVKVAAKDVDDVIKNLQSRLSEKKDVDRAAKNGDEAWIDFKGVDAETKEPIQGADGKNYPLALGSDTFIPGFEANIVGMKANDEKEFTLTFPADYGVKALQKRKVTFTVTVSKVQEVAEPKVDDAFAAKVGPFKSIAELKADIKKQLELEKTEQADREYADAVLMGITAKTKVTLPSVLVEEQIDRLIQDQKQNLLYRGQTWAEFLEAEGVDEKAYREKIRSDAELRVKAGLVLAEIGEKEDVGVVQEELDARLAQLKKQYSDQQMQEELTKPETRRDIASRMLTEKTIDKIVGYASKK